jgi:hypothetical protein
MLKGCNQSLIPSYLGASGWDLWRNIWMFILLELSETVRAIVGAMPSVRHRQVQQVASETAH